VTELVGVRLALRLVVVLSQTGNPDDNEIKPNPISIANGHSDHS
jgi:hypothetical protein